MPRSWPLEPQQLQLLTPVLLFPLPILVMEQRGQPQQWGRQVKPQHKAPLVGSRFVSALHARGSTGAHANP
jgi:hypothetical protein